jgi:hypothetical protein
MKNYTMRCFTFIIIIAISASAYSQQNKSDNLFKGYDQETDSVLKVAKSGIHSFIDNISDENLLDYGFNSKEEFAKIAFDKPIKIFNLKDNQLVFISTWRVPVMVDGEYRALLTIVKENNEYSAVDYGARVLAKELLLKKTDKTCGLLRVYELKKDFIIEELSQNQFKFFPLQASEEKQYDLDDIINMIKNK